jgi:hypothetical protein
VTYEVEGSIDRAMECNCSHCDRKGYLLWFVPRESLKVTAGESELSTYMFNKHVIEHRFCPTCGCAPFGLGKTPEGKEMAAINLRCLDVDRSGITIAPVDGKSL